MVLQLAHRFTKLHIRTVEDVLIEVGRFIFLVDFIVHVSPENKIPVILVLAFFATFNVLINYRVRKMELTFGNVMMALEFV